MIRCRFAPSLAPGSAHLFNPSFVQEFRQRLQGEHGLLPTRGVATNKVCKDEVNSCFEQLTKMAAKGGYELRLGKDERFFEFIKKGGN
jgi:hypothetical protein